MTLVSESVMEEPPSFGLVVATLGRIDRLRTLLDSLVGQLTKADRMVVVAQRNLSEVRTLVGEYPMLPVAVTTSDRGAANGRNVGVAHLPLGDRVLLFPNDSTWFPPDTLIRLRTNLVGSRFQLGAMSVVDRFGPKLRVPAPGTPLTQVLSWRVIEMGLIVRMSTFLELHGFDASLGTGASTPWQSGESTDFVLRALARWPELRNEFVWFHPDIWVGGVPDAYGLSSAERRRKLRAYGRGAGKVGRQYGFPLRWRLRLIIGGLTLGLRSQQYRLLDGLWAGLGRLEGFLGRTIGSQQRDAVER